MEVFSTWHKALSFHNQVADTTVDAFCLKQIGGWHKLCCNIALAHLITVATNWVIVNHEISVLNFMETCVTFEASLMVGSAYKYVKPWGQFDFMFLLCQCTRGHASWSASINGLMARGTFWNVYCVALVLENELKVQIGMSIMNT